MNSEVNSKFLGWRNLTTLIQQQAGYFFFTDNETKCLYKAFLNFLLMFTALLVIKGQVYNLQPALEERPNTRPTSDDGYVLVPEVSSYINIPSSHLTS